MIVRKTLTLSPLGLVILVCGCRSSHVQPSHTSTQSDVKTIVSPAFAASRAMITTHPVSFSDVSRGAGLTWTFHNGHRGKHQFIETTGGGVAFLDYNNDGYLDIFAVQGGPTPGSPAADREADHLNALYRNNRNGTFTDVTHGTGLDADTGYGQGVSVADFDNDGYADIYITSYGGNHLYRNLNGVRFEDVTTRAGVIDRGVNGTTWPLSSSWGDFDADGYLDLFVCHYCRWSPSTDRACLTSQGGRAYCRPQVYEPDSSVLYHNNRDGTFTDVSAKAGLSRLAGKSMGAVWLDYDGDGRADIFVTNDTMPNFLLHNNGNSTFTDRGILAGVAYNEQGQVMSGMGIGLADYDRDGRPDLFAVNFSREVKSVYRNMGHGYFENASRSSRMAETNLEYLGFGLECTDYDMDGYSDLIVGNGHVLDAMDQASDTGSSYAQSQQLFHNRGDGTFAEDPHSLGDLAVPRVTRGLAIGDYDNDGDQDVVMVSQSGPLQLFRNDGGNSNHWISFRLVGASSNRDAVGASVTVDSLNGKQTKWVANGTSYCSHSDNRLEFGLGPAQSVRGVVIQWPSGQRQTIGRLVARQFYTIREGSPVKEVGYP